MKIYSSPYSEFQFDSTRRLLSMVWGKDSQDLNEEQIKAEMNRVLSFIEQYQPRNIIVDSRNYVFTNNMNIQNWITRSYMPLVVESKVVKYAIIISSTLKRGEDDAEMEKTKPEVEYFNSFDEALQWI